MGGWRVRAARNADGAELIALISAVWMEYPGSVVDVDAELGELRTIATAYARAEGRFWVAVTDDGVVGCVGVAEAAARPGLGRGQELHRLYVAARARRRGIAAALCAAVDAAASEAGAAFIDLWTDTRFKDAHRLYERLGYRREPEVRHLNDLSNSIEYHYCKRLAG